MASALFLGSWAVMMGPVAYGKPTLLYPVSFGLYSSIMARRSGPWLAGQAAELHADRSLQYAIWSRRKDCPLQLPISEALS